MTVCNLRCNTIFSLIFVNLRQNKYNISKFQLLIAIKMIGRKTGGIIYDVDLKKDKLKKY